MKKKNENHMTGNSHRKTDNKSNKGIVATNTDTRSITDKVKPRSGRGLANEGTNTSYEEER